MGHDAPAPLRTIRAWKSVVDRCVDSSCWLLGLGSARFLVNIVTSHTGSFQAEADEPAKQQIVVQVLHQYAFATHGIAYLQRSARSRFAGAIGVVPLLYSRTQCPALAQIAGPDKDRWPSPLQ